MKISLILCLGIPLLLFSFQSINDSTEIRQQNHSPQLPKQNALPSTLQHRLDSLRHSDQLEKWLDAWYGYLADVPSTHFDELEIPFNTAWRKAQNPQEQTAWFYLSILSGYYKLQQGDVLKSIQYYEDAYQTAAITPEIDRADLLEYVIKPLGNNYTRLGDYNRALFLQKEGLKISKDIKDPGQEASSLANLSTTARWNGQMEDALNYAEEALKKVKDGTSLQGLLFSTQADILLNMGETHLSEESIKKSLSVFRKLPLAQNSNNAYWYAGAMVTNGDISMKEKNFAGAKMQYLKALHTFQRYFPNSKNREKVKIRIALGGVSNELKNYTEGLRWFNQSIRELVPFSNRSNEWPADTLLYAENTLLDAITGKSRSLIQMGKDTQALAGYQKAAIVLHHLRKTIFSTDAKRLLQQQSLETTEQAIDLAYSLFKKTGERHFADAALQFAEQHKARLLLDDMIENIGYASVNDTANLITRSTHLSEALALYTHSYLDAIQRRDVNESAFFKQKLDETNYELSLLSNRIKEKYPGITEDSVLDQSGLYTQLPAHTILWEYFTGPRKWFGFSVSRQGVLSFEKLGDADTLKRHAGDFKTRWFANGPEAMTNDPKSFYLHSYLLYQSLNLGHLSSHQQLLIVPDGVLGELPFEALITDSIYRTSPASWPYLLLKIPSSQTYSLAVWSQLQNRMTPQKHEFTFSGFFINPDTKSNLATLRGVAAEKTLLHNRIAGQYFEDDEATSSNFLKSIRESEVIHVSTHAFLLESDRIPALQMSDSVILLPDLYAHSIHPSLIVLSACQSADGLLVPGEGIISLAREFIAAGAGGVVAGLWQINDETVAQITSQYYRFLIETSNKSQSLYLAKEDWLSDKQRDDILKLPYYWAGLVYYGDFKPLQQPLQSPGVAFSMWWYVAAGIMLVIGLVALIALRSKGKKRKV